MSAVLRREIEDVIADAEETAAQMQRMVMRLTRYTDRLQSARVEHETRNRDGRDD